MTGPWVWVAADVVGAIHDRQLAEHGGGEGVRDPGLLASALARPENAVAYATPDAPDLAAAYAFGICRNHPFVDGNKRTAWVVARLFLALNGCSLSFDPAETVVTVEALAAGTLDEAQLAAWFRARIRG
ncbi:MAG: type II toxin-antitoxin system death-on-curing family toxin [Aliidongia sp.]